MDYVISLLGPLSQGAVVTLKLFAITLALSIPLGLVLALVRLSRFAGLNQATYLSPIQGVPIG